MNSGVEKNGYMGTDFKLTFPTIDDLMQELVKIGKGTHIFKVNVSKAFRHLNVDPGITTRARRSLTLEFHLGVATEAIFFQRMRDAVHRMTATS